MSHDDYKQLERLGLQLEECPCCGGKVSLWQYSESPTDPTTKVVMCETSDAIGPQDGIANHGCPLYMPGQDHYKATEREAVAYWNDYAKALAALARKNRWQAHSPLRGQ